MRVKTQQEGHLLDFSIDNTLYSFVNLAAIKPQNAAPILSLVPLHMHGYFHVQLQARALGGNSECAIIRQIL